MAEDQDEGVEGEAPEIVASQEPPKKGKGLLFAMLAAVGLGGGGGAYFFMSKGTSEQAAQVDPTQQGAPAGGEDQPTPAAVADSEPEGAEETVSAKPQEFGSTHTFKPFHLNLGNPLENRFVRLEIAIEYAGGEDQKAEIEKRSPQLRDAIISVTQRKTMEFLLGPDGKDQLRLEILNRINQYMSKKIDAVYLTDIIIE